MKCCHLTILNLNLTLLKLTGLFYVSQYAYEKLLTYDVVMDEFVHDAALRNNSHTFGKWDIAILSFLADQRQLNTNVASSTSSFTCFSRLSNCLDVMLLCSHVTQFLIY